MHLPLRLTIDKTALVQNWRWVIDRAGVPAGAAIKADAYGLGAREAMRALHGAGCRDFFVSNWSEAEELRPVPEGATLAVLHGVGPDDVETAGLERLTICFVLFASALKIRRAQVNSC